MKTDKDVLSGRSLGPYRLYEMLGSGGIAAVYRAYQPALSRDVAVKVLAPRLAGDPVFIEWLRREAVLLARLRHPNIVMALDYGDEDGWWYFVTELIDGGSLRDRVRRAAPLAMDEVTRILGPIAAALDYAHAQDILHGDVNVSNILLRQDGTAMLVDFLVARTRRWALGSHGASPGLCRDDTTANAVDWDPEKRLTREGLSVGTPEYRAPEAIRGESLGPPSDQYALAVVAYEMLTGVVPFKRSDMPALLFAHMHDAPPPSQANPLLSAAVDAVLRQGLAKDPADRYSTVSALVTALADASQVPHPPSSRFRVKRPISVLHADVRGYTTVAEVLDPADVARLLLRYHGAAVTALQAQGATVEYFGGDSVLGLWNAPRPQGMHPRLALRGALALQAAVHSVGSELMYGVGVHTGEAVVGHIRTDRSATYTAIGDTVNVAARLQAAAGAGQVVCSAAVLAAAGGGVHATPLGSLTVKGRQSPVEAHLVEGMAD